MGKIIKSLFAITAVAAIAISTTSAYFSSEAQVQTATFNAGSVSINIGQHPGYNSVPFVLNNWMPGDTQDVVFDVNNTSTVPVTLSGYVNGTWGNGLGDQMVHVIAADYWNGSTWASLVTTGNGTFTYADTAYPSTLLQVPAGGAATLRMTARFEPEAENIFQNQIYTAGLYVTGEQVH